jgi:hypothetical protein
MATMINFVNHQNDRDQKVLKEWLKIVENSSVPPKETYCIESCRYWLQKRNEWLQKHKHLLQRPDCFNYKYLVDIGDLMLAARGGDRTEKNPDVDALLKAVPCPDVAWFLCLMTVATEHRSLTLSDAISRLMPFLGESYFGLPTDYESIFRQLMEDHKKLIDQVLVAAGISE